MRRLAIPLQGAQMLFVAFGALVLMPLLTGLDTSVALFTAGIGTLLFQLITKRQVPIFLASSFAFIAPILYGVQTWGIPSTMGGIMAAGVVYVMLGALVKVRGTDFIHRLLPPVVVGPVIIIIGLGLAPVAVNMALGKSGDGSLTLVDTNTALFISLASLCTTIAVAIFAKGLLKVMPILAGIIVGYGLSLAFGIVDFAVVTAASWIAIPKFVAPEFNWHAIAFMIPVAIAPAVEHIGDILAISNVTGKDFMKKPGLHRTLTGDGVATIAAAAFGGPPNTTYSEVTGAVTLTRNFDPKIMTWTAITAITLAFVGKLGALMQTIPVPVMGGIMCLLFGSIAAVGLNTLIRNHVDLSEPRNLSIVGVTLVFGIGGMAFGIGSFSLTGISLCGIVAITMNLLLPATKPHDKHNASDVAPH
ncbi:MAG: uracil-xanthine permease family protein [Gammaproteobacteria bacterium]|uniref:uracil-xanthine permease family protein n=1 Tax=Shewanella hafniensis TaxID=365590 RepID=UPI001BBAAC9A|nr:uracil-xanthine permease family protein [Shewanella hafniensis]MBU1390916.1 uracil-xanthine permease family protein [Gammaproteobacteria bacterium]QYX66476.1 uracil-xanthine permease family protein [Shewanella putrefaciens]MBU1476139.1 uracil-xanthine permease family protein [Gammaproteobacteria bacterium]MBU2001772.1 uracil-xanthine permease family protein [Gammaproteobacteria bacterium]MBU2132256.1 uracil-xanthine permease family protein [Gammaproteobacteria bacterium]